MENDREDSDGNNESNDQLEEEVPIHEYLKRQKFEQDPLFQIQSFEGPHQEVNQANL